MKYIKGFDALRAVSIVFVILSHLGIIYYLPDTNFFKTRVFGLLSGYAGVNIFFTLSGFLITSILLVEKTKIKKINFFNFYIRRFLRLLPPLIIFYIAVLILMKLKLIQSTAMGFLYSVFYMYNFVPNEYYTGELGHTWSLALEEQFYIIWPLVISFFTRKKVMIIIILFTVLCVLAIYNFPDIESIQDYKYMRWFVPAAAPVLIGSGFAILNYSNKESWEILFSRNYKVIFIVALFYVFPLYAPLRLLNFGFIFQSTAIGLFLIWIHYNQQTKTVSFLNNKVLSYVGKISYGLYVYQGLFLRTSPSGKIEIQKFPLNIILTICIAILSYHLLEKPVLKLKDKFR